MQAEDITPTRLVVALEQLKSKALTPELIKTTLGIQQKLKTPECRDTLKYFLSSLLLLVPTIEGAIDITLCIGIVTGFELAKSIQDEKELERMVRGNDERGV